MERPAAFCYVSRSEGEPIIALGQNVISEAMLEIASSNGEAFEKRRAATVAKEIEP